MPDTSDTHLQVTAVTVQAMQEATLKGPASPIEVYSYNLHILDPVGDGPQVICINIDDWCQAPQANSVLGLVIARLQDGTLGQCQPKLTSPPELRHFLHKSNHLKLSWSILYRNTMPKES